MSSLESDPFLSSDHSVGNNTGVGEYFSCDISTPSLELPTSFRLFDISEDNKFLALIDEAFMLQVYELNNFGNQVKVKNQVMNDIPCEINCRNSAFVYISVASETGDVAVSFLQMHKYGRSFENSSKFDQFTKFKIYQKTDSKEEQEEPWDREYTTCRIYRKNEDNILQRPFQGRAVFTKDGLVLVGERMLDVYDAKTLERMHSFNPGSFYLDNYVGFHYSKDYQVQNWYCEHFRQNICRHCRDAGYGLANISAHIRESVIMVYDAYSRTREIGQKHSVKIWSIVTGSLMCSFIRNQGEHVIYVSEDHCILVTNDPSHSALNIYCMKSGTRLGAYTPLGHSYNPRRSTIMLVRYIARHNYILIVGTTVKDRKDNEKSDEIGYLFFEIFSIEQQMKVKYIETSTAFSRSSILALGTFQNEDFLSTPSQFYGVFWETTDNGDRHFNFKTIQLNLHTSDPRSNGLFEDRLWDAYTYTYIGTEKEGGFSRKSIPFSFISSNKTILYLLEKGIRKYVLLISHYAVQLWQLEASDDYNKMPTDTAVFFNNIPQEKQCYLDFCSSTLIYTRSYYGLNYKESTYVSRGLMIEGEYTYHKPQVHFLESEGHISVYVQSNAGSFSEDIILPLSELQTRTTSNSPCQIARNIDYITGKVPKEDFYDIESCLLALLNIRGSSDSIYSMTDPIDIAILCKTEELLESIISPIEETAYFQTMSASRILMRLAYFDKGLELISDFVLQKEFPIAIHNFPIGDNENLLAVLIQRRKLDLFQLLFNQTIINYYNGDSVDLFPLMDSLLCLQKNQLPGLLLKCIDILSYLPVNLESTGLLQWECNTLGDQKSFNNFTPFHQMKKRKSSILNLIRLRATKVEGKDIDAPEIYFDSNEICLIPLPTLNVYDAISYSLLPKNTSYSRIGSLNEMLEHESPVIEVLLTYRWRKYIKISISFSEEIFSYKPGTPIRNPRHLVCLAITLSTWVLFLLQEIKQMVALKWEYWKSTYNYIDILAATLPLVTFILLITNDPHLYEISSLAALTLWFHFILRLRANRRIGILIEIVIQLGVKIAPVIGLMILLIFAFTHSFAILLRMHDNSFFQEQFEGNVAPDKSSLGSNVVLSDQSQQNLFKDGFLAFTTVWFFLYGVFDPILSGDVGNYPMALILAILFSFITALVILNVVIAIMTGAIDETEKKGNRNWHIHLADVSNEVEKLLSWFIEEDHAKYIYYRASRSTVEAHHEKIKSDTKKLRERLLKRRERGKPL